MEILEKGQLPQEREYKATCRICNTKFRFKEKEGQLNHDQRDGDYISVTCPLPGCGYTVTISTDLRAA